MPNKNKKSKYTSILGYKYCSKKKCNVKLTLVQIDITKTGSMTRLMKWTEPAAIVVLMEVECVKATSKAKDKDFI